MMVPIQRILLLRNLIPNSNCHVINSLRFLSFNSNINKFSNGNLLFKSFTKPDRLHHFKIAPLSLSMSNSKYFISTTVLLRGSFKRLSGLEIGEKRYQLDDTLAETNLSIESWSSIVEEKSASQGHRFAQEAFDTFILTKCQMLDNLTLSFSYLDYLKSKGLSLNFVAQSYYLRLLSQNINSIDWNIFLESYADLQKQEPLPNGIIMNIVTALSLTKLWEDSISYIERLEKTPGSELFNCYNSMIIALTVHKNINAALEYVKIKNLNRYLVENNNFLTKHTIEFLLHWAREISDKELQEEYFITFLKILKIFEVTLQETHADMISSSCQKYWNSRVMKINNGEHCKTCRTTLKSIPCDAETVSRLKHECEVKVVKKSDIFQNTTPQEWESFCAFLQRNDSFSAVVDGLNLFLGTSQKKFKHDLIKRFYDTLSRDYRNGKILIITRKHMKGTIINMFGSLNTYDNVVYYFLDDITKDDVFILYAAFHSGFGCKIYTRDYLRNHMFLIGEDLELKRQFFYWQKMHQILLTLGNNKIYHKIPYQFHRVPQFNNETGSWHIPVETEEELTYIESSKKWLCLTSKK